MSNSKFYLLKNREILDILDGDTKLSKYEFLDGTSVNMQMPYLSGPKICDISNKFGLDIKYGYGEDGILSRWMYLSKLIDHCVKNNSCPKLLAYIFSKESFAKVLAGRSVKDIEEGYEAIIKEVINVINGILYFDNNKLIKEGNNFIIRSIEDTTEISTSQLKIIDSHYISDLYTRSKNDLDNGNYDSVLTKARTLLEEVFCYVIEKRNELPDNSGNINKLFKQVSNLYNMHADKDNDKRINTLISGLNNIVSSMAEMRNITSDSHGMGSRRINLEEHHARLYLNVSIALAEFILEVEKKFTNSLNNEI